jgi:hypothetical protein
MDVFAGHITIHFAPQPLLLALAAFLLALTGYGLAASRRVRGAAGAVGASVAVLAAGVALAAPVPTSVQDLRSDPRLAWHHGPAAPGHTAR